MNCSANERVHPVVVDGCDDGGLTKREYFAAMSLQGILANPELHDVLVETATEGSLHSTYGPAKFAAMSADALIAALNDELIPATEGGAS